MRRVLVVLALMTMFMAFGGTALADHVVAEVPANPAASCMGMGLSSHATNGEPVSTLIERDFGGAAGGVVGGFAKAFSKFHEGSHQACEHAIEE
jgi:hypothetical protein